MGNLVKYTLPKNPLPLTEEQKREIEEARKLPFVYDEDCPPQTKEELTQFRRANARKSGTA